MLRSRFLVFSLFGIAIAAIIYLETDTKNTEETTAASVDQNKVDYQISQFEFTTYNADGKPNQTLRGDVLTHFPNRQQYVVESPTGALFNQEQKHKWQMRADTLLADSQFEELQWKNNVHLEQYQDNSAYVALSSQSIHHDIKEGKLSSVDGIEIREFHAPEKPLNRALHAEQFSVDMKTEQLTLQGQVRASYE